MVLAVVLRLKLRPVDRAQAVAVALNGCLLEAPLLSRGTLASPLLATVAPLTFVAVVSTVQMLGTRCLWLMIGIWLGLAFLMTSGTMTLCMVRPEALLLGLPL